MIIGTIFQYYQGIGDTYQFSNWIIRTSQGTFISNDPKQTKFNSAYTWNKTFDDNKKRFLVWYDSETVTVE